MVVGAKIMFDAVLYSITTIVVVVYLLVLLAYPIFAIASFVGRLKRGESSAIRVALGFAVGVIVIAGVAVLFVGLFDYQQYEFWSADHGPQ